MNELNLLAILEGNGNNLGDGAILCIFSILLVFSILAIIILITWLVNKGINKLPENKENNKVEAKNETAKTVEIKDDDAMAAVLVATIDMRNQTKKNIKVISVKEIK